MAEPLPHSPAGTPFLGGQPGLWISVFYQAAQPFAQVPRALGSPPRPGPVGHVCTSGQRVCERHSHPGAPSRDAGASPAAGWKHRLPNAQKLPQDSCLQAGALGGGGWVGALAGGHQWELLGGFLGGHSTVERGVRPGSSPAPTALSRTGSLLASHTEQPLLEPQGSAVGGEHGVRTVGRKPEPHPRQGPGPFWSWRLRAGGQERAGLETGRKALHRGLSVESVRLRLSPRGPGHPLTWGTVSRCPGCRGRPGSVDTGGPRPSLEKPGGRGQGGVGGGAASHPRLCSPASGGQVAMRKGLLKWAAPVDGRAPRVPLLLAAWGGAVALQAGWPPGPSWVLGALRAWHLGEWGESRVPGPARGVGAAPRLLQGPSGASALTCPGRSPARCAWADPCWAAWALGVGAGGPWIPG